MSHPKPFDATQAEARRKSLTAQLTLLHRQRPTQDPEEIERRREREERIDHEMRWLATVDALTARLTAETARVEQWARALRSLTPQGSEFQTVPECVAGVRARYDRNHAAILKFKGERDAALARATAAEGLLREARFALWALANTSASALVARIDDALLRSPRAEAPTPTPPAPKGAE